MSSESLFIPKKQIDEILALPPVQGKRNLEPFASIAKQTGLPFQILEDTAVSNDAEIHLLEDDLWLCLEGKVAFLCGGTLGESWFSKRADGSLNKNEIKSKTLNDATKHNLTVGDWLWIPAGVPHQHSSIKTTRLAIIKVPKKS